MPADSPLGSYRLVSTCDAEAAQAIVSQELTNSRINRIGDESQFRFEMDVVHFGDSLLAWNCYTTDIEVRSGLVENTVALVLGHRLPVFRMDDEPVACTQSTGVLVEPSRMSIARPAESDILILEVGG